jgi:hypothetical protein
MSTTRGKRKHKYYKTKRPAKPVKPNSRPAEPVTLSVENSNRVIYQISTNIRSLTASGLSLCRNFRKPPSVFPRAKREQNHFFCAFRFLGFELTCISGFAFSSGEYEYSFSLNSRFCFGVFVFGR